jgi:hypothetical protein
MINHGKAAAVDIFLRRYHHQLSAVFSRRGLYPPLQSGSCETAAATRTRTKIISAGTRAQQAGGQRGGGASPFRRADAAQVCSNVGFVAVDGVFECSVANAARQIVSERW